MAEAKIIVGIFFLVCLVTDLFFNFCTLSNNILHQFNCSSSFINFSFILCGFRRSAGAGRDADADTFAVAFTGAS